MQDAGAAAAEGGEASRLATVKTDAEETGNDEHKSRLWGQGLLRLERGACGRSEYVWEADRHGTEPASCDETAVGSGGLQEYGSQWTRWLAEGQWSEDSEDP